MRLLVPRPRRDQDYSRDNPKRDRARPPKLEVGIEGHGPRRDVRYTRRDRGETETFT